MTISSDRDMMNPKSISSELGIVLKALYDSSSQSLPGKLRIDELLSISSLGWAEICGALSILSALSIVAIDERGNVAVRSRYARFALGSLSDFLINSIPVADPGHNDADDRKFIIAITKALETVRKHKIGLGKPLHSREIVNVIIKGRQIRGWREKDVYLHVYHKEWQAYHLIGLGKKIATRTLDELAHRAMEIKLGLKPYQYELDKSINPDPVDYFDISGTHGAITHYTIWARVAQSFSIDLNAYLQNLINDTSNDVNEMSFRWFTLDEIEQGLSNKGETIMQSTPRVLRSVDPKYITNVVGKVDRLNVRPSLWVELSNRVNIHLAISYGIATLLSLLVAIYFFLAILNNPDSYFSLGLSLLGIAFTIFFGILTWRSSS